MGTAAERALVAGDRVAGRYLIEAPLGEGGMAAVYRAVDESNGRRVALKRRTSHAPHAAKMFEREYHTLSSLAHPRIIEVYDFGVDHESAYYTMELLDGSDLRELAPLSPRRACRYLRDVASSLALLHTRRLLHRDVTPRNVRVTSDDRGKLIDFGVLSSFGVADVVAGTAPSLPPEALGGSPLDQRADLFALGALSYWVLSGRHAYAARAFSELPRVWQVPPAPPSVARRGHEAEGDLEPIPEALDALVLALLSANPLARPASAAEVIDRLTAVGGLEPDMEPLAAEAYLSGGPAVGREREQGRLSSRLETALEGTGTSITLEGDPGIGSSRLLSELAIESQLHGATPLVVDAQLRRGAYGVIHDLIAKLLEAAPEEALGAAASDAAILSQFSSEFSLRLSSIPSMHEQLAPGEFRVRVQTALADWLFAVSDERPLVIAIDNAHRLDDASAAVVATLAYHVRDHRIMLAMSVKPGAERSPSPIVDNLIRMGAHMRLEPLGRADVERLLGGIFGDAPHLGRLAEHVYRSSAGNPQLCLDLVHDLVRLGVIHHAGGVWVLPRELPQDEHRTINQAHAARLSRLSAEGTRLAEALSIHRGPLPIDRCLVIADHEGVESAWQALEELTREGVLGHTETHYHFVHDRVRDLLEEGLDPVRRKGLHRYIGDALARDAAGDVDTMLDAGFHLVQGGDEGRGADLLATAGLLLGYDSDEMGAAIPPLRAALEVFRRQRRSPHEIAKLVGPLCNASWYCDRRLADEFGDEAIALLSDLLGLSLAARLRPYLGKHLSLYVGLAFAAVRFLVVRGYGGIDGLRAMIVMYFNCVLSLGGVAATCFDTERAIALATHLEHLTALGEDHAATMSYRFATLLSQVPQEYLADTINGYRELLARISSTKPMRDLPEDSRLMMIGGMNYAIGAFESFRDGRAALDAADALERVGLKLYAMVADQVRANYHACRGEVELADYFRDRVEMHAVQAGSGWQAEVWAPSSAIVTCVITNDVVGMKRTSEELDRLSVEVPSLRRHAAIARGASLLLTGSSERALVVLREGIEDAAPRSFIGWGAMSAAWARAANDVGRHAEAKAVCEKTLALIPKEDQALTAMYLSLHLELARAETHLGDSSQGGARIDALLAEHGTDGGPVTMGGLHRMRALIALHLEDIELARHHVAEMERHVVPTNNPGLIQQCEELRSRLMKVERDTGSGAATAAEEAGATVVDVHVPPLEHMTGQERGASALSFIIARTGGRSGYLFELREGALVVTASEGGCAPEHIVDLVQREIRAFERNRRRASTDVNDGALTMLTAATRTMMRPKEHDYRVTILSADGETAFGAAAVRVGDHNTALREGLLRALTAKLMEPEVASETCDERQSNRA